MATRSAESIIVTYRLTCAQGEDPARKAEDIAFEQTVELPPNCVPAELREQSVGQVRAVHHLGGDVWVAVLEFPAAIVGRELSQLLNLLFGNISLKAGVLVTNIDLPPTLVDVFSGPRFGIDGLREICGVVDRRPLLCTALKPVGLSSGQLAELTSQFAVAGIDIIKDDHGLADQATAPLRDRVARCQEAITDANRRTGLSAVYFPHVGWRAADLAEDVDYVRSIGCPGVLVSPLVMGLDAARWLAETSGLAALAHPAIAGAFFHPQHGIAPDVLLGDLFRLAGSDGVIYPNVGGRFPFSEETCTAINEALRRPIEGIARAAPVPAGGISIDRVPYWIDRYGPDSVFLIGSSLYEQPSLSEAAERLADAVRLV